MVCVKGRAKQPFMWKSVLSIEWTRTLQFQDWISMELNGFEKETRFVTLLASFSLYREKDWQLLAASLQMKYTGQQSLPRPSFNAQIT